MSADDFVTFNINYLTNQTNKKQEESLQTEFYKNIDEYVYDTSAILKKEIKTRLVSNSPLKQATEHNKYEN